ncbi:uncharacterized protein LOC131646358 [Vicia villosa]|uniref:uncharacterized protein LOC131646358 n=1 Tax=Vicia villosa TaxID=3911 RepID=UPI00273C0360|nr:uncharacterized protein LOC131646358 [Vicia villosa]
MVNYEDFAGLNCCSIKVTVICGSVMMNFEAAVDVVVERRFEDDFLNCEMLVCGRRLKESNNLVELTIDELQSSLLVHEQRMNLHIGDTRDEKALKVSHEEQHGGRGTGRDFSWGRGKGQGRGRQLPNKATMECFKCHKLGPFQYEYPRWKESANYAKIDKEKMLLMSFVEANNSKQKDAWFLDSGCSNYMCGNKQWFYFINEYFKHSVKLGNDSKMEVMRKGTFDLRSMGSSSSH